MPKYMGAIDNTSPVQVSGWAVDVDNPDRPVTVTILLMSDGKVLHTRAVLADEDRPDAAAAGLGSRYCGFTYYFSDIPPGTYDVQAYITTEVANISYGLANSPQKVAVARKIRALVTDITDHCNLQCPFCTIDRGAKRPAQYMETQTFEQILKLLPITPDNCFFISCMHEPTLHKQLGPFVSMIPAHFKKKAFFTTNLAKRLDDKTIETLAHSNLLSLNISLDTLDDELFRVMRKGGRLPIYMENLRRVVDAFAKAPNPPKLHYITQAWKTNIDEVPVLVERAFNEFNAFDHEVRYTINLEHFTDEFREEHLLPYDEWAALAERLKAFPRCRVVLPPENYLSVFEDSVDTAVESTRERTFEPARPIYEPMHIRVKADGTTRILGHEKHFMVNINSLRDPLGFFMAL